MKKLMKKKIGKIKQTQEIPRFKKTEESKLKRKQKDTKEEHEVLNENKEFEETIKENLQDRRNFLNTTKNMLC